jgi:hypothetical protein
MKLIKDSGFLPTWLCLLSPLEPLPTQSFTLDSLTLSLLSSSSTFLELFQSASSRPLAPDSDLGRWSCPDSSLDGMV